MASKPANQITSKYPKSLIHSIKNSIVNDDDVRSPLVALLHFNRGLNARGSCYREILFFIIVALGKNSIDIGLLFGWMFEILIIVINYDKILFGLTVHKLNYDKNFIFNLVEVFNFKLIKNLQLYYKNKVSAINN